MKANTRIPVLVVLSTLALAACASGGGPAETQEPTVLQVENQSTFDQTIYVVRDSGQRRRLGMAGALQTSWFTIPSSMVFSLTPLRFQADPIGATRAPVSDRITVSPGDTVVLRIPPA